MEMTPANAAELPAASSDPASTWPEETIHMSKSPETTAERAPTSAEMSTARFTYHATRVRLV